MMNGNLRIFALAAAWALTVTIGFLIGRGTSSDSGDPREESERERFNASNLSRSKAQRPGSSAGSGERTGGATGTIKAGSVSLQRAVTELHSSLRQANGLDRTESMLALLSKLEPDDFAGFITAFREDDLAGIRRAEYGLIIGAWVNTDPYAAAEYLAEKDPEGWAREQALTAWAATDPDAALAWIKDRNDPGGTNNWYLGAVRGIASNDPQRALELARGLPEGRTRSSSIGAIVPYVVEQGFDYATSWVAEIGEVKLQAETARRVADSLTRLNPARAGEWVSAMGNTRARRDASEEVSDEWARRDLEAARQWVETLPADTITEGAEGVVRHMARSDPERAAQWINSLGIQPGENGDFDGTRRILIYELQRRDPQLALENIYSLTRQSDRDGTYHQVVGDWARRDGDAARAWVAFNADALPQSVVRRFRPREQREQ